MQLTDEQLEILHNPDKGGTTEFEYRLAWTRTYLKKYGLLENSSRGVWALTPEGRATKKVDEKEVTSFVKEQDRLARKEQEELDGETTPDETFSWQQE